MQRPISRLDPRMIAALGPTASVAIAVAATHAIGLQDSWWAAISAFVVMQGSFGESLYRAVLRIAGTVLGAAVAFGLAPAVAPYPLLFTLAMCLATFAGLFSSLVFRHSYASVLALVTFVMVMCEALYPQGHLGVFALERVANVVVGTMACILVAALMEARIIGAALRHEHTLPGFPASGRLSSAPVDLRRAAMHALQGVVAVALLSAAVSLWKLGALAQGMVTTLAVLIVPLDTLSGDPHQVVVQRMAQRLAGCLIAGAATFALLPLLEGQPLLCQAALCLGVWGGTFVQSLSPRIRYIATQFTVAFLMVFVQDHGWTVEERPALERLAGVLAGIVTLYGVFLVFQGAARRR